MVWLRDGWRAAEKIPDLGVVTADCDWQSLVQHQDLMIEKLTEG